MTAVRNASVETNSRVLKKILTHTLAGAHVTLDDSLLNTDGKRVPHEIYDALSDKTFGLSVDPRWAKEIAEALYDDGSAKLTNPEVWSHSHWMVGDVVNQVIF